jgi:hypothetical protein
VTVSPLWGKGVAVYPVHKRVLLLGPTGVDKRSAVDRLCKRLELVGHSARFVDFENDFLKSHLGVKNWMTFLAQDIALQFAAWGRAWEAFEPTLDNGITILGLHATYVSGVLGLRSPVHIPSICEDFKPTLIITLIDDVFMMWSRTEERAEGKEYRGRPSFEELLVARRAEQLLGDLILSHTATPGVRHVLCAVGNCLDVLVNLIVFDAAVTYISFPITAPRKLAKSGDVSFIELINQAHRLAASEMMNDRKRAFISPLAIDELPIVTAKRDGTEIVFNLSADRWNLNDLWGNQDLLILPGMPGELRFPIEQVEHGTAMIDTDVGWRDRRLVLQASSLAIVCPKPPGEDRITRGVTDEIETAGTVGIVCNYWQKKEWDPEDFVGKRLPAPGSMGLGATLALVQRFSTLEELIRAKP